MIDETGIVLRGEKNARVIKAISELYGKDLAEAADLFYRSDYSSMIEEGIADLHCRSDKYLATLVMED